MVTVPALCRHAHVRQGMSRWLMRPKTVVHVQMTTAPTAASSMVTSQNLEMHGR
jgi:hypothetical protein